MRILLAKIEDESGPGEYPAFYITQDEYESVDGRSAAARSHSVPSLSSR